MYLKQYKRAYTAAKYNIKSGKIEHFTEIDKGFTSPKLYGCCFESPKGWTAVYSDGTDLYLQIQSQIWNLGDESTKLSYSTLNDVHFRIKNENKSFEVNYRYWMKDALMSDLDDEDSDHDFFAYVVWLCKPERYRRIVEEWA